jgi:Fe2+ or Zn2+ uptake regulation protein
MKAQNGMKNRNTLQRRLVLETVRSMQNHPDAEMIYARISKENPLVSKATVYRNLKLLARQGLILHIPIPDGADCFDFNTTPHYHLKCRGCGGVFDVDLPYQEDLCEKVRNADRFCIESHQIVFRGLCPACWEREQAKRMEESSWN